MLYLACTTISSVDLAQYGVSLAKDWVSVKCGTMFDYTNFTGCIRVSYGFTSLVQGTFQILQHIVERPTRRQIICSWSSVYDLVLMFWLKGGMHLSFNFLYTSIANSLSLSTCHRPDMTEILLKKRT